MGDLFFQIDLIIGHDQFQDLERFLFPDLQEEAGHDQFPEQDAVNPPGRYHPGGKSRDVVSRSRNASKRGSAANVDSGSTSLKRNGHEPKNAFISRSRSVSRDSDPDTFSTRKSRNEVSKRDGPARADTSRSISIDRRRRDSDSSRERSIVKPEEVSTVVVRNISRNVRESHIEEIFEVYGKITRTTIPIERRRINQDSERIAYVDYETHEEALSAIDHMDENQKNLLPGLLTAPKDLILTDLTEGLDLQAETDSPGDRDLLAAIDSPEEIDLQAETGSQEETGPSLLVEADSPEEADPARSAGTDSLDGAGRGLLAVIDSGDVLDLDQFLDLFLDPGAAYPDPVPPGDPEVTPHRGLGPGPDLAQEAGLEADERTGCPSPPSPR
ncbi:RNA-binding protein with serine-rich domain 1-like protein [Smittium mucronatum]|uniref:RNA-binding protein with serine-rich domain 1-like protein n=1 Tax=Smittium mucronatum TaxID=133383 RepID=A0A1R0H961_9FUNG|nr:RNA-binding protein with serine-rich domain 1-like protein [Smittium mucronatum]